jgi:hypothetical protein
MAARKHFNVPVQITSDDPVKVAAFMEEIYRMARIVFGFGKVNVGRHNLPVKAVQAESKTNSVSEGGLARLLHGSARTPRRSGSVASGSLTCSYVSLSSIFLPMCALAPSSRRATSQVRNTPGCFNTRS